MDIETSFQELYEMAEVSPELLVATMDDYARSGAGILASGVIAICDRTPLRRKQMKLIRYAAKVGVAVHKRLDDPFEVRQYQAVHDHMNVRLWQTLKTLVTSYANR